MPPPDSAPAPARLLPPLEASSFIAKWTFFAAPDAPGYKPSGDTLLQAGAPAYGPALDVLPFMARLEPILRLPPDATFPAVELPGRVISGPVPPIASRLPHFLDATKSTASVFGRLMWTYWAELKTKADFAAFKAAVCPRVRDAYAYEWWVYDCPGPVEAAFTSYDFKGVPIPVYTIPRCPLADLAAALEGPAFLTTLFKG